MSEADGKTYQGKLFLIFVDGRAALPSPRRIPCAAAVPCGTINKQRIGEFSPQEKEPLKGKLSQSVAMANSNAEDL